LQFQFSKPYAAFINSFWNTKDLTQITSVGGQWQFILDHHSILSEFLSQTLREIFLIYSYFTSVRSVLWQNNYDLSQNIIIRTTPDYAFT